MTIPAQRAIAEIIDSFCFLLRSKSEKHSSDHCAYLGVCTNARVLLHMHIPM